MDGSDVDEAILAMAMFAVVLGVMLVGVGMVSGLVPLFLGLLGFGYLKVDITQINQWLTSQDDTSPETQEDALTMLRERYARGEVNQDEFESRLNDLLETESIEQAENHRDGTPITERSE